MNARVARLFARDALLIKDGGKNRIETQPLEGIRSVTNGLIAVCLTWPLILSFGPFVWPGDSFGVGWKLRIPMLIPGTS